MGFFGRRMVPEPLIKELLKIRYTHYVTLLEDEQTFVIQIKNGSKADLTSNDIKAFISSLPDGAVYPVSQTGFDSHYGAVLVLVHGIMNNSGTNQIISSFLYASSRLAFSVFNTLPRKGRIAWYFLSLPVLADPPAESPSTKNNSFILGFLLWAGVSLPLIILSFLFF